MRGHAHYFQGFAENPEIVDWVADHAGADLNPIFGLVAERGERLLAERERSTALIELVEKAVLTEKAFDLG